MLSSPVFGAALNTDRIVMSNDGYDALNDALANEHDCSAVSVQLLEFRHYCYKKECMRVE